MKRIFLSLLIGALSVTAMTAASRKVNIPKNPESLQINRGLTIQVRDAQAPAVVTVTGDDKAIIDEITVKLNGNTLIVSTSDSEKSRKGIDFGKRYKNVSIVYTGPLPSGYTASSAAKINLESNISNQNVTVTANASSSGDVNFKNITCKEFKVSATSSGDVNINTITTTSLDVNASSSGDVEATNVIASKAAFTISSSADVDIKTLKSENLAMSCSSSSDLEIDRVTANNISVSASSGADVDLAKISAVNISVVASSGAKTVLSGIATAASLSASSGATIVSSSLECPAASTRVSSGGKIK